MMQLDASIAAAASAARFCIDIAADQRGRSSNIKRQLCRGDCAAADMAAAAADQRVALEAIRLDAPADAFH